MVIGVIAAGLVLALVLPALLDSNNPASGQKAPSPSLSGQIGPTQTLPAGQDGPITPKK